MNTKSKPWDHLPNATHIDRITTSYRQHQDIWGFAWYRWINLVNDELRDQAINEAYAKCEELDRLDIWYDPGTEDPGAILALIAYDDCAHYLNMPSQELTTIALLGVTPAILLLPAVLAFEEIAKLEVTT